MLTLYVLQYKLVGFNLPLAENWLVALRFHVAFLMNARKWEPLTDFCSDVPSVPPYVSGDYFKMQFDWSERIIWAASNTMIYFH